jgi:uncharacterized protein involved in outer membrane biogenesis
VSQQPIDTPGRRRAPASRGPAGERRPLRERLTHPTAPNFKPPSKKALSWAGAILLVLAIAIAVLIALWDWNWFRGPVERTASARLHRPVTITGNLNANIWSWQPWVTVDGVHIANPAWAGGKDMANVQRITVQVRLLPLLWGRTDIRLLRFDGPNVALYADAKGRKTWDFSNGRVQPPMKLPPIHSFIVKNGRLAFLDVQRKLKFNGSINASEQLGAADNKGFGLLGRGTINGAPFRMDVTGGPLINIKRDQPYPFDADIRAGDTYLTARGAVPRPFDMGQFYMVATARGPDMAALFPLTGVALPNTPPYSLRGRLTRDGFTWRITDIGGRVGDSDLSGVMTVETGRKRLFLKADLKSNSLDFDDMGALFGGSPSVGPGETASPEQKAVHAQLGAQQRMLPDTTLDVTRIRAMDADVSYKALSIRDAPVKLSSGSARVKLQDGLLKIEPLELNLARGRVAGRIGLDARKALPVTDMDLRLTNARIESILPLQFDGAPPLTGALVGRAKLSGTGNSLHKAFANADGQVVVVAPGGEIRKAFAELAGVNVVKGLGLLHKTDMTPVNCAVATFDTKAGVMRAGHIVVDTGPVLINGEGAVNLDTERMDFTFRGHNKKFRLVRVLLPIKVTGPLTAAKLGVEPGGAIAQAGAGVALGALLSPLGAILPFVDPGLAKDANCAGLVAEASRQGAPVTAKALTPRR